MTNWLIKPFTMFGIAWLFSFVIFRSLIPHELAKDYLARAILLGAAPCTAMAFVWSHLTKETVAYAVLQVATNDLIILVVFTPIVALLLGIGGVTIPWDALILSVVLFVVIPLLGRALTRNTVIKKRDLDYLENSFILKFGNLKIFGLLLTLVIIFLFQGDVIINNPLHILLMLSRSLFRPSLYFSSPIWQVKHYGSGMIGASNFFELSVAVAIFLFGTTSPAALATIVDVLTEVPVMLILVKIANNTRGWFSNYGT